jgi:hypothetical protein
MNFQTFFCCTRMWSFKSQIHLIMFSLKLSNDESSFRVRRFNQSTENFILSLTGKKGFWAQIKKVNKRIQQYFPRSKQNGANAQKSGEEEADLRIFHTKVLVNHRSFMFLKWKKANLFPSPVCSWAWLSATLLNEISLHFPLRWGPWKRRESTMLITSMGNVAENLYLNIN